MQGENTPEGVKFSTKPNIGNPIPPPPATARHYGIDEGSSIPRMFRSTLQHILADGNTFFNTTTFPLGAVVQPFAELSEYEAPVPLAKQGGESLLRCSRCGAYVNPGFMFIEGGTKFKCNLCEGFSPVPSQPSDGVEKPELTFGTYDFNAPASLGGKKTVGHNILLVLECTPNAINFGKDTDILNRIDTTSHRFS
jgi:protein transport protein SEC24